MDKTLPELIVAAFPELENKSLFAENIWLQNDLDNKGDYISIWGYSKPLPKELEFYIK